MELPSARIVKQAGIVFSPPRPPRIPLRDRLQRVGRPVRDLVGLALGLWPLTAVILLAMALIFAVGANASVRP